MPPTPCMHCGHNYMPTDMSIENTRLCNCCELKVNRQPKGVVVTSKTKMLIECDRDVQIEIEELCLNEGQTISDYFVNLHKTNMLSQLSCKSAKGCEGFSEEFINDLKNQPSKKQKDKKKYE